MQTNNESNIWRTVVIVAACMIAGVFAWQFLTRSSSDLQALFVGVGFGALAGFAVGWFAGVLHSGKPREYIQELNDAYASGRSAGRYEGYRMAIAQDPVCEVVVPHHERELVLVQSARR
jgi:hypothetical protein